LRIELRRDPARIGAIVFPQRLERQPAAQFGKLNDVEAALARHARGALRALTVDGEILDAVALAGGAEVARDVIGAIGEYRGGQSWPGRLRFVCATLSATTPIRRLLRIRRKKRKKIARISPGLVDGDSESFSSSNLVAGAGFEPAAFRL